MSPARISSPAEVDSPIRLRNPSSSNLPGRRQECYNRSGAYFTLFRMSSRGHRECRKLRATETITPVFVQWSSMLRIFEWNDHRTSTSLCPLEHLQFPIQRRMTLGIDKYSAPLSNSIGPLGDADRNRSSRIRRIELLIEQVLYP